MLFLLACATSAEGPADVHSVDSGVSGRTVVWLTIDTLNEDYLGRNSAWDTTPALDALMDESVVFENVTPTRNVTPISLPSILTGTWARTHGMRAETVPDDMPAMAQELLGAEGYRTFAYSSNRCEVFLAEGWDKTECSAPDVLLGHLGDDERDAILVSVFLKDLAALEPHEDAFFWLHLRDPHADYTPREPWISEFAPDGYDDVSPITTEEVNAWSLGGEEVPDGMEDWLSAVYASQVRASDELLAEALTGLRNTDRMDIVWTGTDHGEALLGKHRFTGHGCSLYASVMDTTWSLRAPGVAHGSIDELVSTVDVLPTTLALLELESPDADGRSLLPMAAGEAMEPRPNFFERGPVTAGVVHEGRKYWLNGDRDHSWNCRPYETTPRTNWPGLQEALFELGDEERDLMFQERDPPEKTLVCSWVTETAWVDVEEDESNDLVTLCRLFLEE